PSRRRCRPWPVKRRTRPTRSGVRSAADPFRLLALPRPIVGGSRIPARSRRGCGGPRPVIHDQSPSMTAPGRVTAHRAPACGLLRRAVMVRLLPVAAFAALLFARSAGAACAPVSSANGLCTSMQGNTCFVSSKQCPVVNGSTLDFGTKDVVFRQSSTLNVGTGTMTILAGSLELQPGTALLGPGGTIVVQTTGNITVLRPSTGAPARIDVVDPAAANRIELDSATGTIQIDGIVDA